MYKNNVLVGTTADQEEPRYCSAVFDDGDVLKLEFIPDAGSNLTKLLGGDLGDVESMVELTEDITDNIYTISFPSGYHGDYPLLRCFYAAFEKETQDYSLTVDPGNYCTVEHLYVKKGDEVIETIDGANNCSVEEGCSVGIELSVPAGLYIREIIVNDVTVATYTDEDVANGNSPDGYLLENISENTIVKFKTYPNVLHRNVGCTASGPGKVEMYRNGNYVGTTTSQDGGYPYLTCEALDEGEVLKLVFVSDKGGSFTKLMAGEHDGYEDTDFTGKVVDNTLTITMDFDNEEVLQYRSFIAYFEGPEPSTDNTLSTSAPTILTGQTATMSVSLTNEDEIIMTEFYMQLPEGITIEEDEDGYPKVTLNSERSNNHSLEVSRTSEGLYHFLVFSSRNNALKGHEGELFSMNLICAESVAAGTYQAIVKNILLSDPNKNEITQSDFTFDIIVMDVAMGDANGDGRINGMDIVEMVDYIMERESDTFVFAAADLTGDQKVNGMDLVELVSLVMAQGATQNVAPAHSSAENQGVANALAPFFLKEVVEHGLTLTNHDDGTLALGVENPDEFILAQMIVEVDGGQLTDVTTDTKHVAVWRQIGENRYTVLAYSTKNRSFTTNDEVLRFQFDASPNSIRVKDVMLASSEREERYFDNIAFGDATGIINISYSQEACDNNVYDLSGRKATSTLRNSQTPTFLRKGIYIMNGKKVVRK
ncbi:MAG: dockerin type I repeat-containing protein [Bacteroidaceae bacterium]|nr:dockerin type I repeat-containing protein [Bacteroidaceae bacterium]